MTWVFNNIYYYSFQDSCFYNSKSKDEVAFGNSCFLDKNENGKWGDWSELDLITIPITLDTSKHRIVVHTAMLQLYTILSYAEIEENKTDTIYSFACKDENGDACNLMIITRKQQGNRKQLYINYENRIYLYNI